MTTDRKFLRVSAQAGPLRLNPIPEGGFCLSAFVILSKSENPNQVLLGRLNPQADWDRIGALDSQRVEMNKNGWMVPSSHLIFGESPEDAAKRILAEQLNIKDQRLVGPLIFSEVYGERSHWDLEFIFQGMRDNLNPSKVWADLRFVDTTKLKKEEMARSHEDILAHVGKWKA